LSFLAGLLAVKNIVISPDAVTYGLVSQQILEGNGARVPMIWFDSNAVPINGTVPLLIHPPLFPTLLAVLGGLSSQSFLAVQLLNVISYVFISLFSFLLMNLLCNKKGIAFLTGMLIPLSFPLMRGAHHVWSETLFISLLMACTYFVALARKADKQLYSRRLFIASLFAGAAIMTRNAGITLVTIFLWETFILVKSKKKELKNWLTILSLLVPPVIQLLLYARNYAIAGTIRGHFNYVIDRSYLEAFQGTIGMIFSQFHLGNKSITLIIASAIFVVLYAAINSDLREKLFKLFHAGLDTISIFIIMYTALIIIALTTMQPHFESRFVSPLVPFLLIISILTIVTVWEQISIPKLSSAGIILSLSIVSILIVQKTYLNREEFFYKQKAPYKILHSCVYKWMINNYSNDTIVVSNRPYYLSFFSGYSTVILPHKRYFKKIPIPENMETVLPERMEEIGSGVLALFSEAKEEHYGPYIFQLFNTRMDHPRLTLAHECSDGVVYNLKKE
jgi:hypothetical protein